MSKLDILTNMAPFELIEAWAEAFRKANGKEAPQLTYSSGWFRNDDTGDTYRRKQLVQMTLTLEKQVTEEAEKREKLSSFYKEEMLRREMTREIAKNIMGWKVFDIQKDEDKAILSLPEWRKDETNYPHMIVEMNNHLLVTQASNGEEKMWNWDPAYDFRACDMLITQLLNDYEILAYFTLSHTRKKIVSVTLRHYKTKETFEASHESQLMATVLATMEIIRNR